MTQLTNDTRLKVLPFRTKTNRRPHNRPYPSGLGCVVTRDHIDDVANITSTSSWWGKVLVMFGGTRDRLNVVLNGRHYGGFEPTVSRLGRE